MLLYVTVWGPCVFAVAGATPPKLWLSKFHAHVVGAKVDWSVKVTEPPALIVVTLAVNSATGELLNVAETHNIAWWALILPAPNKPT